MRRSCNFATPLKMRFAGLRSTRSAASPATCPFITFSNVESPGGQLSQSLKMQYRMYHTTLVRLAENVTNKMQEKVVDPIEEKKSSEQSDNRVNNEASNRAAENAQNESPTSSSSPNDKSVEVRDEKPNFITRVKRMPLTLIEEIPLPAKLMGDLELIMSAWSEEHARQYKFMMWFVRSLSFMAMSIIVYFFYRSMIGAERMLRGNAHVPQDMKVGCVVYLDISENGRELGRIVIGLLTEICPLYCEYFHRRCTGSGGSGDSFRGLRMISVIPKHASIMGEGREMTHGLEGFAPNFLPTEARQTGPWRGALSSIAAAENRESPNFCIHASAADYSPQVFGIVLGGYDVVERMHATGLSHAGNPKRSYVVTNCGELCTLDKANIVPLPWKLYESVSEGYDDERFGERSDRNAMTPTSDLFGMELALDGGDGDGLISMAAPAVKKPWYRRLW